ncbi:MAG: neutral/alkaline non-lysosomal ceramidase N-terminal domain-containing protein [Pseudomonadales bacterium]
MSRLSRWVWVFFCTLLLGACARQEPGDGTAVPGATDPGAELKFFVGAASADISPSPGAFIAGDARNRRFAGVHDPLFAKAVVLSDGEASYAVVTVDNIGLNRGDIELIRARAVAASALPGFRPEHIIVSSTHTHSGPDVVGLWGPDALTSGRDQAYVDQLIQTTSDQIVAAGQHLRSAELRVASGEHDFGWVTNVTEPELLDRQMGVLQFLDSDGIAIATLVNFACHPTVMDAASDQVSSDYVSGFYKAMAETVPGEHLFLQGAIGGWVQPDKRDQHFSRANAYGSAVAARALNLLANAESDPAPALRAARREFLVPLENPGFQTLLEAGVLRRPLEQGRLRTEVALLEIGPAVLVTHPGETSPQHSLDTRALIGRRHSFVLGLAGDALGYILKPEYFVPDAPFPSADYLTATSISPSIAPLMMSAVEELVDASR